MNLKKSSAESNIDSRISNRLKQWEKQQNQVISIFITGISCDTNNNIINHLRKTQTIANIDAIGHSLQCIQIKNNSKSSKSINIQFLSSDVVSIILHYYNSLMVHLTCLNNTSINEIVFKTNTSTRIMSPNVPLQSKKIDGGRASLSNTKVKSYQFRYFTPAHGNFVPWNGLQRKIIDHIAASCEGKSSWMLNNYNYNINSNSNYRYKLDKTFVDGGLRCGAAIFVAPLDKVKKVGLQSIHKMLRRFVNLSGLRYVPKMLFITEINKFKQLMLDEYGQVSIDDGAIGTNTIAKTVFGYHSGYYSHYGRGYRNGENKTFDLLNDQITTISNYCQMIGDKYNYDIANGDEDMQDSKQSDNAILEVKEKFEKICQKAIQFVVDDLRGLDDKQYHLPIYLFDGDGFTQMQTENSKASRVVGNIFYLAETQALSIW